MSPWTLNLPGAKSKLLRLYCELINFLNNSAGTLGGAINNEETGNTINLTASGGNINFSDNIDHSFCLLLFNSARYYVY